jgi:hypothetical protein
LAIAGCPGDPSPSLNGPADREAEIRANLALLGPEDERLAEQQKYCPLMEHVRLGETARPYRVTVKGVSAFVCCESCVQAALNDPDQALAKIRHLEQTRAKESTPSAAQR